MIFPLSEKLPGERRALSFSPPVLPVGRVRWAVSVDVDEPADPTDVVETPPTDLSNSPPPVYIDRERHAQINNLSPVIQKPAIS